MFDNKEKMKSDDRFSQFVRSATLTACLGAACLIPGVAGAQTSAPDSTMANPPVSSSTSTTTTITVPDLSEDAPLWPEGIDYRILGDPYYSYSEITRAKAHGLSDGEIGRAFEIAREAQVPSDQIINAVENGSSFWKIEDFYGVSHNLPDRDYGGRVRDYIAAYKATGNGALKQMASIDLPSYTTYGNSMNGGTVTAGSMNGGMPTNMAYVNNTSGDIRETLSENGNFGEFLKLARRAGLDSTLDGPGPLTVFAPTDSAFDKLPKDQVSSLWKHKADLKAVLEYHIIPARIDAATAMAMTSPTSPATLEGDTLQVTTTNGNVMINDAEVTTPDIQASNGIIHAIDTVLMPTSLAPSSTVPTNGLGADSGAGAHNGSGGYNGASGAYNGAGSNTVTPANGATSTPATNPAPSSTGATNGLGADTGAGAHNGTGGSDGASGAFNGAGANAVTPGAAPATTVSPTGTAQ